MCFVRSRQTFKKVPETSSQSSILSLSTLGYQDAQAQPLPKMQGQRQKAFSKNLSKDKQTARPGGNEHRGMAIKIPRRLCPIINNSFSRILITSSISLSIARALHTHDNQNRGGIRLISRGARAGHFEILIPQLSPVGGQCVQYTARTVGPHLT